MSGDSGLKQWMAWDELLPAQQDREVARPGFWDGLQGAQQRSFLESADWRHLRRIEPARRAKLEALVSIHVVAGDLGVSVDDVYWFITARGMPSWLVDGEWMFDGVAVADWLEAAGRDVVADRQEQRGGAKPAR